MIRRLLKSYYQYGTWFCVGIGITICSFYLRYGTMEIDDFYSRDELPAEITITVCKNWIGPPCHFESLERATAWAQAGDTLSIADSRKYRPWVPSKSLTLMNHPGTTPTIGNMHVGPGGYFKVPFTSSKGIGPVTIFGPDMVKRIEETPLTNWPGVMP